jgi:hypothetical protein
MKNPKTKRAAQRSITASDEDEIVRRHLAGDSINTIARDIRRSKSMVAKYVKLLRLEGRLPEAISNVKSDHPLALETTFLDALKSHERHPAEQRLPPGRTVVAPLSGPPPSSGMGSSAASCVEN